jgi:hypothetical protein
MCCNQLKLVYNISYRRKPLNREIIWGRKIEKWKRETLEAVGSRSGEIGAAGRGRDFGKATGGQDFGGAF